MQTHHLKETVKQDQRVRTELCSWDVSFHRFTQNYIRFRFKTIHRFTQNYIFVYCSMGTVYKEVTYAYQSVKNRQYTEWQTGNTQATQDKPLKQTNPGNPRSGQY